MDVDRDRATVGQLPPARILRWATLFYAVLLGLAWLAATLTDRPLFFADLAAARRGIAPLGDAALGLGTGVLVIAVSQLATACTGWGESLARALAGLLGRLSLGECAVLALLSGVAEEAFFRGALQPHLGLLPASLLFAAAHFVPRRDFWPWAFFSLGAGLLLGALFELTGNLLAPVLAHVLVNAVNLRVLSRRYAPS